jgi:hypothetical protein
MILFVYKTVLSPSTEQIYDTIYLANNTYMIQLF